MVQPRKTCPGLTERLLMGHKNQTNLLFMKYPTNMKCVTEGQMYERYNG